jgi:hypothetical protein
LNVIGADVLRNAAMFLSRDIGAANRIKQGCFAVVDMPHDCHHRRARDQHRIFFHLLDFQHALGIESNILHLIVEIGRYQRCGVYIQNLIDAGHHAETHQFLDHITGLDTHLTRQISYGDNF